MRTALSSAAAPRATLDALLGALGRHGLVDVELRMGDGHGIGPAVAPDVVAHAAVQLRAAGVRVSTLLTTPELSPDGTPTVALVHAARVLDARWVLPAELTLHQRLTGAESAAGQHGLQVAVAVGGATAAVDAVEVRRAGHAVVWEAHPGHTPLAALCDEVLDASMGTLVGVRLRGGGPEGSLHEGRGIGAVMSRLAVAAFDGIVTLAPSDPKYHVLWDGWLGRRGGWGCGSQSEKAVERERRVWPLLEEIA